MVFITHKHKHIGSFIKEPINLKYFLAYVIYSRMFSGQKKPKKTDPEKQCILHLGMVILLISCKYTVIFAQIQLFHCKKQLPINLEFHKPNTEQKT